MERVGRRQDAAAGLQVSDVIDEREGAGHRGDGRRLVGVGAGVAHVRPLAALALPQREAVGAGERAQLLAGPEPRLGGLARGHRVPPRPRQDPGLLRRQWRREHLEHRVRESLGGAGVPDGDTDFPAVVHAERGRIFEELAAAAHHARAGGAGVRRRQPERHVELVHVRAGAVFVLGAELERLPAPAAAKGVGEDAVELVVYGLVCRDARGVGPAADLAVLEKVVAVLLHRPQVPGEQVAADVVGRADLPHHVDDHHARLLRPRVVLLHHVVDERRLATYVEVVCPFPDARRHNGLALLQVWAHSGQDDPTGAGHGLDVLLGASHMEDAGRVRALGSDRSQPLLVAAGDCPT
mmetsp:Transcript_112060/g.317329  ORF Transcript_112060/g.317329 Transcript_112060/m.317329 type:complete len:352 (-) Transcript_112060:766-1821(-)